MFGKLTAVCCFHIVYPKPLSQKGRFGSVFMGSSLKATRAAVQWSKHCGSWHSCISPLSDMWQLAYRSPAALPIFKSMLEDGVKLCEAAQLCYSNPHPLSFYRFPTCVSRWSKRQHEVRRVLTSHRARFKCCHGSPSGVSSETLSTGSWQGIITRLGKSCLWNQTWAWNSCCGLSCARIAKLNMTEE